MRRRSVLLAVVALLAVSGEWPASARADAPQETAVAVPAVRRIDLETHTPVHVITRQDLARSAHLSLGQVLQRLPFMSGSSPNLNSNAAGDGSVLADIGGLGRARCVVMLNGRRLPVNELLGAPSVDLDAVPLAAVERIEIFLGGASPTWGADAVSGVINVITRAEAHGVDLTASTAHSTDGRADSHRASAFGGRVFSRGHASLTLEYRKQDPIESSARDFSARSEALGCLEGTGCIWPFGSTITPAGVFNVTGTNALDLPPGRYTLNDSGLDGSGGWREFQQSGPENDLYSTQGDAFLRAGRSGGAVSANTAYELTDLTTVTLDVLAASDRTRRRLSALPLITTLNGAVVQASPTFPASLQPVTVAVDSFYNPFGTVLTDVRRRLSELGPRDLIDDRDMLFAAGVLRHLAGPWDLETAVSWGRTEITEQTSHELREERLAPALGPSGPDASGEIRCGARDPQSGIVAAPLAGCVPLDLFHGDGTISGEMLDYITTPGTDVARVTQVQAGLLGRRTLELGAEQPVRIAVAAETRRLSASSTFDEPSVLQPLTSAPRGGHVAQHDLTGEIAWPLGGAGDEGGGSTLTAGGRVSWFNGQSPLGSLFAAAAWRPAASWLVRGRVTQVYRAPSAGELFLGRRERVVPLANPCLAPEAQGSPLCLPGDTAAGGGLSTPGTELAYFAAGNPQLEPETGYSASAGVVWNAFSREERFIGLDLTWVQLEDTIRAPGALELIEACRDRVDARACDRVVAGPSGNTFAVDGSLINGGRDESLRMDLEARSDFGTRFGHWRADLFASHLLLRRLTDVSGKSIDLRGTFDVTQSATGVAYPELEAQARLQWRGSSWSIDWTTQFLSSFDEVRDRNNWLPAVGNPVRRVGSVTYHDVAVEWSAPRLWSVRLTAENVLDRAPPRVNNGLEANTDAPTYRLEGRVLSLSVNFSR